MTTEQVMTYWKSKGRVAEPKMPIDWESIGRAMTESSVAKKWVCKFAMGFFRHEKNMSQWKIQSSAQCPWCGYTMDDKHHVTKCPHLLAQKQWEKSLTSLDNWLVAQKNKPIVRTTIIMHFHVWQTEGMDTPQGPGFTTHSHNKLGWNLAFGGVLMEQWRTTRTILATNQI